MKTRAMTALKTSGGRCRPLFSSEIGEDAADGDLGGGDLGGQGGDVGGVEEVGELLEGEVAAVEAVLETVLVARGSAGADVAAGMGGA